MKKFFIFFLSIIIFSSCSFEDQKDTQPSSNNTIEVNNDSLSRETINQDSAQIKQIPFTFASKDKTIPDLSNQFNLISRAASTLQPTTIDWGSPYNGSGYLNTWSIIKTNDNGYMLNGYGYAGAVNAIYLIKVNSNGGTDWSNSYGAENYSFNSFAIQQTSDNGYVLTGEYRTTGISGIFLLKIDSWGNITWLRFYNYQGTTPFWGNDVKQYTDGGFVITGRLALNNLDNAVLIKTDSSGNIVWWRYFKIDNSEVGRKVLIERNSGNIVVFSRNFYKFNANGTCLSYKKIALEKYSFRANFEQTLDNGFVLIGSYSVPPASSGDTWHDYVALLKLSNSFEQTWLRTYSTGTAAVNSDYQYVKEIPGNGFILTGTWIIPNVSNKQNAFLLKVNTIGSMEWMQSNWSFGDVTLPIFVDYTNDGGYVIGGNVINKQSAAALFLYKLK